jgi:hypothetical protein
MGRRRVGDPSIYLYLHAGAHVCVCVCGRTQMKSEREGEESPGKGRSRGRQREATRGNADRVQGVGRGWCAEARVRASPEGEKEKRACRWSEGRATPGNTWERSGEGVGVDRLCVYTCICYCDMDVNRLEGLRARLCSQPRYLSAPITISIRVYLLPIYVPVSSLSPVE